ncbi:MAG: rRNA maturation RNase YbeY [Anaerolineales bacterium]|nr:rRNA maturation RNase YbeY [Anaerolineales bacterium]
MTVFLEIATTFADSPNLPNFKRCVVTTLESQQALFDSDITIVIDDDDHIHKLNQEFLGQDAPTDVLAFPAGHHDPDTGHHYLGDVVISYPRAEEQARAAGHPTSSELCLLIVHGVLHLLGYDHDQPELKAEMWHAQAEILSKLGVQVNSLDFSMQSES